MVAMIRPTLMLRMSFDEGEFTEDIAAEVKRSYSYVSPTLVESHETGRYGIENFIDFTVKIRAPYWSRAEEGADELWSSVMLKWFTNMFAKLSTTTAAYNANRVEKNERLLDLSWINVDMTGSIQVALYLEGGTTVSTDAAALLDKVRRFANEGAFGEAAVACVRIPSRAALAEHREAVALVQAAHSDEVALDPSSIEDVDTEALNVDDAVAPELPALNLDRWGLELEDGTILEFDATTATVIA